MFDASTRQLHVTPAQKAELISLNIALPTELDRWLQIMRDAGHPLDGPVDVFCDGKEMG